MKIPYIKYLPLAILGVISASCEPELDNDLDDNPITVSSGTLDFSNYVAVGNSLTAGLADNALYTDGQKTSFAALLANQMKAAGGGEFTIPFMSDNIGGFADIPDAENPTELRFGPRLVFDVATNSPVTLNGTPTTSIGNVVNGPFNNMGVPGAKAIHLFAPGYGNAAGLLASPATANPYFVRMASSPDAQWIEDILAKQPTFFSYWLGNNDILDYAIAGGDESEGTITPTELFTQATQGALAQLSADGTRPGVVANIPDINSTPFFTRVPYNPIPMDEATASAVNQQYAQYNGGLQAAFALGRITADELSKRTISFSAGANGAVIIDENLTDITAINPALIKLRQTNSDDLIVLTASTFIGTLADENNPQSVRGVAVPLEDKWVLTPEEQADVDQANLTFNTIIEQTAAAFDLAVVDVKSILSQLKQTGISIDGGKITGDISLTGAFSLDGIHLNPRGNAELANRFIKAINSKYGSQLKTLNPANFKTLTVQ